MRIKKITALEILPVRHFQVDNLSDLVVIAGPNGVGKTRLILSLLNYFQNLSGNISFEIEATNSSEEELFGKKIIDTSNSQDAQKLISLLQSNQLRRNLKSSIVYFESNRSISSVKALAFQFEYADPWEEQIGWNVSFGNLANRWQDTQHAIFKKLQSQKSSIAARAIQLKNDGHSSMNLDFSDPLEPFRKAFSQLLGPKVLASADIQNQVLRYEFNGETRDINTLSSGEREVLNIAFDFILRKPSDCVVFFDEPELHLHPELLSKLISTLKDAGENNQFIFISHSPDVISASLDDSVVFLTPPKDDGSNQAIMVSPQDENTEALSRLGQSVGVVALGKRIVLIEGKSSSLDKQTYSHILKNSFPNLVLLPSGGKGNLQAFEVIREQVLNKSIWGVDFFMLADRDATPTNYSPDDNEANGNNKFRTLSKYHLENYFLDSNTLAKCFEQMESEDSWLRKPKEIEKVLKEIARENISYAASLIASKQIRDQAGNIDIMVKAVQKLSDVELIQKMVSKAAQENSRIAESLDAENIMQKVKQVYEELDSLLKKPGGAWKSSIPGKPILSSFCSKANIVQGRLKTLYIQCAKESNNDPFAEIYEIFNSFSK